MIDAVSDTGSTDGKPSQTLPCSMTTEPETLNCHISSEMNHMKVNKHSFSNTLASVAAAAAASHV